MNLLAKVNLILVLVFVFALVPAALISRHLLVTNAESQVIRNARIMMETALAMRGYTVDQVRPLLAPLMADKFLPQSVPAFAATEIFNKLRADYPEYTYKEATLNPTNPRNRAVDWETDLVNEFRRDDKRREIVGSRDTPLGRSFYLSKPIRVTNQDCLACHTRPEEAPASMVAIYGNEGGYGWKMNEVVGAQIVQVPMSEPVGRAETAFRHLLIVLVAAFGFTLVALNILLTLVVIRPVRRLAALADRVSRGDVDVPDVEVRGRDEVAVLAGSFHRMRISLAKAMAMLEDD